MNPKVNNNRQRTSGNKSPLPRILIVCEGEKTEYDYFTHIADKYKLTNAVFLYHTSGNTSAQQILDHGIYYFNKENRNFQEIYLVFDRDSKHDFKSICDQDLSHRFDNLKTNLTISIPSVEIWFLLHFYKGNDEVFLSNKNDNSKYKTPKELKKILGKKYNDENLADLNIRYNWLLERFNSAQNRAFDLRTPDYKISKYENKIFTNMDELVERLCQLKK